MRMRFFALLLLLSSGLWLAACSDDDDSDDNAPAPDSTDLMANKDWSVSYFSDAGDDQTAIFDGWNWNFKPIIDTFGENGIGFLSLTKGAQTKQQNWRPLADANGIELSAGSADPFGRVSSVPWIYVSATDNTVRYQYTPSTGNDEPSILEFTQN